MQRPPDQMLESRDMTNVPVIVAANKMDRVTTADAVAIRERKDIVHLVNSCSPTYFCLKMQIIF